MNEQIFLDKGDVRVTNTRFIVNGQTYAISNVTSVKFGIEEPDKAVPIIAVLSGLLFFLGKHWLFFLSGLFLIVYGIFFFNSAKAQYSVILHTSSGETQALKSMDKSYIEIVVSALNKAIVSRG